ncbi:MAG: hypothetical protein EXR50_07605 [Dehalococcoidia bacterium]|nr:hypothetical protein [Dehalococcoidia bacterium]
MPKVFALLISRGSCCPLDASILGTKVVKGFPVVMDCQGRRVQRKRILPVSIVPMLITIDFDE